VDVFLESKLHKLFEVQPDAAYEVGEDVHVKIACQKVRAKEVDGEESLSCIWVKGKIALLSQAKQSIIGARFAHTKFSFRFVA
jgi:hypothetical protein